MTKVSTGPFTHEGLERLHAWVHDCLDEMIAHVDTMPAPLLGTSVPGFGHATLREQLLHVLQVETGWMGLLRGAPPGPAWDPSDYPTLTRIVAAKRDVVATTRADLAAFTPETLNEVLTKAPDGWRGEVRSPAFVLLHVLTHACHHKGQMATMCRQLGHPPPDTDMQRI